jgi:hypothetical protein
MHGWKTSWQEIFWKTEVWMKDNIKKFLEQQFVKT